MFSQLLIEIFSSLEYFYSIEITDLITKMV